MICIPLLSELNNTLIGCKTSHRLPHPLWTVRFSAMWHMRARWARWSVIFYFFLMVRSNGSAVEPHCFSLVLSFLNVAKVETIPVCLSTLWSSSVCWVINFLFGEFKNDLLSSVVPLQFCPRGRGGYSSTRHSNYMSIGRLILSLIQNCYPRGATA